MPGAWSAARPAPRAGRAAASRRCARPGCSRATCRTAAIRGSPLMTTPRLARRHGQARRAAAGRHCRRWQPPPPGRLPRRRHLAGVNQSCRSTPSAERVPPGHRPLPREDGRRPETSLRPPARLPRRPRSIPGPAAAPPQPQRGRAAPVPRLSTCWREAYGGGMRARGCCRATIPTGGRSRTGREKETRAMDWVASGEWEDIRYETAGGVAKLTINRPEVRNAFRPTTLFELARAFQIARDDPAVGVILLTGAGTEAFCSGGDQRIRGDDGYLDPQGIGRLNVLDLQVQIRRLPKPVIAMVAGYAIGGGHVLHLVCDLTIAADHARFGQTGPKAGSFDAGYGSGTTAG